MLTSIAAESADTYLLLFENRNGGPAEQVVCRLDRSGGDLPLVVYEPYPFNSWMGDAESVRSVTAAVQAVDRARQLSLRYYE